MAPGRCIAFAMLLLAAACVPARAATIQITMQNLEISPAVVSAKVGDTIEWINKDVLLHSATARNGDSDVNLPPKITGSFVLKRAGTVDYYSRYHPNMQATINVAP